jgi:hypothetical protein
VGFLRYEEHDDVCRKERQIAHTQARLAPADAEARYRVSPERQEETREYGAEYRAMYEAEFGPIPQTGLDEAHAVLHDLPADF